MPPGLRKNKDTQPVHSVSAPRQFLSAIDKITLAYCAWFIIYMTVGIFLGRAINAGIHLPLYLLIVAFVLLLALAERKLDLSAKPWLLQALRFVRGIYPVFLFAYYYSSLRSVSLIIFPEWLDPWFMDMDSKIWGYLPSLEWGRRCSQFFFQELFHFAYFCYYPLIVGLPLYLYLKNKPAFKELIFNITFVFYACYIFYSIFPVVGGRFHTESYRLSQAFRGGIFTRIMAFIYNHSGHWGGAFPSSHVAIAVVLTIAGFKFTGKWGYLFAVISVFLSVATVYCHYHWFVDAVAGLFTGILGYFAANWTRRKLERDPIP
ncbi:MAG: phosphatase PAP2 family protein [Candidatus Cloacimonetes bacterium]|nr:phosphatase PAP2 family protein [Candidatus Cloacimonadota bacterium]